MLITVKREKDTFIVESFVPARCATKPYHVILFLDKNLRLKKTACDCNTPFCTHSLRLYNHFIAEIGKGKIKLPMD